MLLGLFYEEQMNEFDVCSLFPAYSKCINNANKSIVICCFVNTETFHLQAKNTEISKNIAIFQKHVRVSMSEFKSKRNFTFVCFGNQTMALMAATKFEKDVLCVMAEFEKVTRKPTLLGLTPASLRRASAISVSSCCIDCFKVLQHMWRMV